MDGIVDSQIPIWLPQSTKKAAGLACALTMRRAAGQFVDIVEDFRTIVCADRSTDTKPKTGDARAA